MNSASIQRDVKPVVLERLRMVYQRIGLSAVSSLLVSSLVVAALWQAVGRQSLLPWLFVLWSILAVRYLFARRFLKLDQSARVEPQKWIAGYVIGAAATGMCWGLTLFFFSESPRDQSTLLLIFVIAGISAFASAAMASIPLASNAFMLSSLLPVTVWLFSFEQYIMTLIALVYMGLMLLLSRQVHDAVLSYVVSNKQNNALTPAEQEREARHRTQNKLLHSVMESTSLLGIWVLDRDYRYLMFNAAHSNYAKKRRSVDIAIGMSAINIVQREEFREFFDRGFGLELVGHSLSVETMEEVVQDGSTTYEYFEHHGSRIRNDEGEVVGLTIFSHNITKRKRMEYAMEDSRNFLIKVINSISDNISVKDSEHRWVLLNDTCCAMLGHPKDVLLGKSDYDFLPKEQADVFREKDDLVFKSGQINVNEEVLTGADGKTRYLLTQKTPFTFGNGQHYLVGISRDITERKAVEKAFGDSEHFLQEAQRIAHIGSWDVDLVRDKLDWSDEIFRIWEIDSTQFKADFAAFLDTVHPEDRVRVSQAYSEAIANHSLYEVEHRLLFSDGRVKYILEQGEPQYDAQGKPVRFIGTSLDITERKRMEEQLRMKEYALDHSGDAIFLIDEKARFTYINEQACKSLGYSRAELLQMGTPDIDPAFSLEKAMCASLQAIAEGVITFETRHQRRDGSLVPVEIQLSSLEYAGRTLTMAVARNITDRKRLQNELLEREREFRSLAENLPDNIARWDVAGRYLYVNPVHERTLGAAASNVIGQQLPDTHAHVKLAIAQVVATGKMVDLVRQSIPVGDEIQHHEVSLVPEFDVEGRVVSVLGLGRNMTEFYRVQQAVVERERELRALAESSPGMMGAVYSRPDGSICMPYVSSKIEELFGLRPQDVVNDATPLMAMTHPDDARRVADSIAESARNMTTWHEEYRILHPTRGERWMESNTHPEPHPDGGIVWYGYVHDITERKRSQQQLELLDRAIDMSADAIFMMDEQLQFTYVNEAACRSLGYSRDELLTMEPCQIDPDMPREAMLKLVKETPLGLVNTIETRHRAKDGRTYPVEVSGVQFEEGGARFGLTVVRDITERRQAERALRENYDQITALNRSLEETARDMEQQASVLKASQEQLQRTEAWYRGILQSAPDGMLVMSEKGTIALVNAQLCRMFGYADDELIGQQIEMLVSPQLREEYLTHRNGFIRGSSEGGKLWGEAVQIKGWRKDDSEFFVDISLSRTPNIDSSDGVICAAVRDVTEKQRLETALAEREHESRTLIDNTPDTIARYNRDGIRVFANQALANGIEGGLEAVLGKTPVEIPGGEQSQIYQAKLHEVLATGADTEFESVWLDKHGQEVCSHIRLTAEFDANGTVVTVLAVGRDITERNNFRQKIHQMAFYDDLTSLPNRALFNDRLHQVLHDAKWHDQLAGVMLLDLDRFKAVNDTLGHPVGDALLREAALRLNYCVRTYDTVARLGGDEFAILLPDIRSGDDLGRVANKILTAFNEPFLLEEHEVFVSTSIGIAVYPDDDIDPNELIKQADSAMYFAKRSGRNNFRFYSKDLTASASEKLTLESQLRRALERNELELYYQPKVRLADSTLVGSEALLRWNNPQRGLVPPDQFILIAEDSGLIIKIGHWVLRDACRTACDWNGPDKPLHKVAINLSARQFLSNDLVKTVRDVLQETGCQPQWIELEITESLLLDEQDHVLEMLKRISTMGITIAIDDFGTGYSSLSYLARFPINTLKIDRSFIGAIATEQFRAELVKAILSIARCLGQEVVAEGVETLEQAAFLKAHGCQIAQGYLYSKPVPKATFEAIDFSMAP